jgi:hypothetical protein
MRSDTELRGSAPRLPDLRAALGKEIGRPAGEEHLGGEQEPVADDLDALHVAKHRAQRAEELGPVALELLSAGSASSRMPLGLLEIGAAALFSDATRASAAFSCEPSASIRTCAASSRSDVSSRRFLRDRAACAAPPPVH